MVKNQVLIYLAYFLLFASVDNISGQECYVAKEKDPGVVTQESCIFPFTYKGVTYNTCTYVDHPEQKEWCSTKVDENGVHVSGGNNWGECRGPCPRERKCPPSWTHLDSGCYKVLTEIMDKVTAQEECMLHGGYLVDITSKKELESINSWYKEEIQSPCLYQADSLWIGIETDSVKGPWISDLTGNEIEYNNWLDTEPDNYGGNSTFLKESCAAIFADR